MPNIGWPTAHTYKQFEASKLRTFLGSLDLWTFFTIIICFILFTVLHTIQKVTAINDQFQNYMEMWILKKWALKYHGEKACQKKQSRELNLLLLWLYWSLLHLNKHLLFSYKKLERKRCGCMFNMMLFSNLLFQPKVVKTLNS